jgi:hypothetical protein
MIALQWPLGLQDGRSHIRQWLMAGGDVNAPGAWGLPVWAQALMAGHPEAVDELVEAGANLNARDRSGNGWLHWGIGAGLAPEILILGLQQLDHTWWQPNRTGHTPFHLAPMALPVANALGARYWSERRSWSKLTQPRDPEEAAQQAGALRLARAWAHWRGRCAP